MNHTCLPSRAAAASRAARTTAPEAPRYLSRSRQSSPRCTSPSRATIQRQMSHERQRVALCRTIPTVRRNRSTRAVSIRPAASGAETAVVPAALLKMFVALGDVKRQQAAYWRIRIPRCVPRSVIREAGTNQRVKPAWSRRRPAQPPFHQRS